MSEKEVVKRKRGDSPEKSTLKRMKDENPTFLLQAPKKELTGSVIIKKETVENNQSLDDEEEEEYADKPAEDRSKLCPYLDTINRVVLDFDFEKLCSVNMSNQNVYACLVCGKYFQGRGKATHAHTHSLMNAHHVFLNLGTLKFYCLPDNYQIMDMSLEDITYYLKPTFSAEQIKLLETSNKVSRALDGSTYLPGIVGLNNIKANDYVNVSLQILCRITDLRNFFFERSELHWHYRSINFNLRRLNAKNLQPS